MGIMRGIFILYSRFLSIDFDSNTPYTVLKCIMEKSLIYMCCTIRKNEVLVAIMRMKQIFFEYIGKIIFAI